VVVESTGSTEKAVEASLMVGETGERRGWLSQESLMHSRVKMLRSKREVVSVVQMRKEAKGLAT
jgi:hypothetical protein